MNTLPTENILGYRVVRSPGPDCVADVQRWIDVGAGGRWLACLNPHSYAEALRQPGFAAGLRAADWLIPDGIGIVLGSRLLGGEIRERVTGSDIFHAVSAHLDRVGGRRVFFLGSTDEALDEIRRRMQRDYPNVEVVGTFSPPFKAEFAPEDLNAMVQAINAARPDVLWVGMTAPKQELWIRQNLGQLQTVKFAAAVGAVFDFYTGRVQRSPVLFQRMGLEWLPRLVREPRRLWRRTFVSAPTFLADVARARIRRGSRHGSDA